MEISLPRASTPITFVLLRPVLIVVLIEAARIFSLGLPEAFCPM